MSQPEGKSSPNVADAEGGSPFLTTKKEFIQSFFKRASEFTEELLRENERLRFRILELEAQVTQRPVVSEGSETPSAAALRELVKRIEELEQERERLLSRFRSVQAENADFEHRYKEIERENNSLANLYVASFQLHATLDLREIRQVISEILINLIGAKIFAVLLLDEQRGLLRPFATYGIDREQLPQLKVGEGRIGQVVASGLPEISGTYHGPFNIEHPAIVTPLRIKDRVVGAIVVWEFFRQKTGIEDVDHELFNLLAAHAASALLGARLSMEMRDQVPPLWVAADL
jgi:hypothetical protein